MKPKLGTWVFMIGGKQAIGVRGLWLILKSSRKSRYGHSLSPCDTEEEDNEEESDDDDDVGDDWLMDDEFAELAEFEVDGSRFKSQPKINGQQGSQTKKNWIRTGKTTREKTVVDGRVLSETAPLEFLANVSDGILGGGAAVAATSIATITRNNGVTD